MALDVLKTTEKLPSVLSPDEATALFDHESRRLAGMPAEEFLAKWDAGEYRGLDLDTTQEGRNIEYLVLLIPFGRRLP
jgi:hypothetical protein